MKESPMQGRKRKTRWAQVAVFVLVLMGGSARWGGSAALAEPLECGEEVRGVAALMRPGGLTVFGELHGTAETPEFVGEVACRAVRSGHAVRVGMEFPKNLQPSVDAYLSSEGSVEDVEQLLKGRFWNTEDGRSSKAMLGLMEKVRLLKRAGKDASVFFFDIAVMHPDGRDAGMAGNILSAMKESPDAVYLVLVGNLHARTNSERRMGWHLAKGCKDLVSLNVGHSGGTAWLSTSEGRGPTSISGRDSGAERFIETFPEPDEYGYNGIFHIGAVTASAPAKASGNSKAK